MKNIVIFVAPGSGKGTFGATSSLRSMALTTFQLATFCAPRLKKGTELGKTAQKFIDNGQLIPDDLMVNILALVYDAFGREHKSVTFDSFPISSRIDSEALKQMLGERGDKVVAMSVGWFVPRERADEASPAAWSAERTCRRQ